MGNSRSILKFHLKNSYSVNAGESQANDFLVFMSFCTFNEILKKKPDLCVSGVNHGSNSSINVIYSGTMSAAIEASIEGVPAIGFSLLDYSWKADFDQIKNYIKKITMKSLKNG